VPIVPQNALNDRYDLVVAGTGFGSLFFIYGYLKKYPDNRVLALEWGRLRDHEWQIANQRNTDAEFAAERTYLRSREDKPWNYNIGYGGGTNCWYSHAPRLHPNDFRLRTKYGVGEDWPMSYDELEPYYLEAEQIMIIAGPDDIGVQYPRSGPFPHPAHNFSSVDKIVKAAMPDTQFAVPCSRLRFPVGTRGPCCDSAACSICPTEAKFTALNTFGPLHDNPNFHIALESKVIAVETAGGTATGLRYETGGQEHVVEGDLIAIGCNAIHTPYLLQRSGFSHPALGKYLHEKRVINVDVLLDGLDNFDGGIPFTSFSVALLDGEHRREAGGALIYFMNHWRDGMRTEWGKWRQTLPLEIFIEELPQETNFVADEGRGMPVAHHPARSEYSARGEKRVLQLLPDLVKMLPVEDIVRVDDLPTNSHIQGTCRMGTDPAKSIVDRNLVHHEIRNLMVLGTAVWPSCGTANPSLTAAALSLRAAEQT
jgi:choline dehydrogenase-like flavoprotein